MNRKFRELFKFLLWTSTVLIAAGYSGCSRIREQPQSGQNAAGQKKQETVRIYSDDKWAPAAGSETDSVLVLTPALKSEEPEAEISDASLSGDLKSVPYVEPVLAGRAGAEVFLKSRLIPGKPRIIVYRVKETDSSASVPVPESPRIPSEKIIERAAIKPEPVILDEKKEDGNPESDTPSGSVVSRPQEHEIEIETANPSVAETESVKPSEVEQAVPEKEEPAAVVKNTVSKDNESGEILPYLEIISPEGGTFYTDKVRIEGRVSNSESDTDSVDRIDTVTWEVPGKKEAEELFFGSDGIFLLDFPTRDFSGTVDIIIKVKDKSGVSNRKVLRLFDGNTPPELILTSPVDGTSYGAILRLEGRVTDRTAADMDMRGPERLEYTLFSPDKSNPEEQVSGEISISPEGVFEADLITGDLSGTQKITLSVRGVNGKISRSSVTVTASDGDIPGFELTAGENSAVISWDPLPGAEGYSLYYSTGKESLSESKKLLVKNAVSPVVLENLEEGLVYNFILSSSAGTGPEKTVYWSSVKKVVALTPETLKPLVTGEYNHINLVWLKIPGCGKFDIFRKDGENGRFRIIRSSYPGTEYTDTDVRFGENYSYRIQPAEAAGIPSGISVGTTLEFPEEKTLALSRFENDTLKGMQIQGSYLFLAGGPSGIKIVDIADKNKPVETGWFNTFDAQDIFVRGERAYVADGAKGLKILDISSPRDPRLIGSRKTSNALSIAADGSIVFIADGVSGIKILDISSERRPVRLKGVITEDALDLNIQDGYLYAADGPGGVKIFRITNSSVLVPAGTIPGKNVVSVAVKDNLLAAADQGNGIILADISDRNKPRKLRVILDSSVTGCDLEDNYLYYTSADNGLSIYEVSDPRRPVLFDSVRKPGAKAVEASDGIIYTISDTGYETFRSFTTGRSFVVAEFRTDGKAYSITAKNNFLFLADHRNGVKIVNTGGNASSKKFSLEGVIPASFAESVFIREGKLFIADGGGGLKTADITIKDGSISIGKTRTVDLPGKSKSVTVYGDYAYVSSRDEGINIINMKTHEVKNLPTENAVHQTAVGNGYIYAAEGNGGIGVYSMALPGRPEFVFSVDLDNITSVISNGKYVVAGGEAGIAIIDVSNPLDPVVVSQYATEWVEDLFVKNDYLYIAAGSGGLLVMDIRNPSDPVLVSSCSDIYAAGVDVDGDLAYVADIDGFKVVKILIPSWLRRK